ncbi:MAG: tRNA epoxyqueuosine(34) reductase QueG [Alphaproteobacteria bacterium]|nr:tRNA epoxyqueuosine(34) reductase QueG [Alphaproteobacteria bacterium]
MAGIKEAIREKAVAAGFDAAGFAAAADDGTPGTHLAAFLARGLHGDMGWMARTAERRASPRALWAEARSVVSLGASYAPAGDPLASLGRRDRATVSVYARGRDYHIVLKKRLKSLARWIADSYSCDVKVFVDTAPVMEKPLAARAGVGWQGKHTNLVSRRFGSWLFLGEVFTTLDIAPDTPTTDLCGTCDRCRDACPTDALAEPYRIEPRRCVSYLTIEHKGAIASGLRALMGNRIYGCDDCLAACPWNKFATPADDETFPPRDELAAPRLAELVKLDDARFRRLFAGSPIKRTGRDRFVRNVLIAIGNSADASLADAARECLDDGSPLVRAMAVWALARHLDRSQMERLGNCRMADETNAGVRAEWHAVLGRDVVSG